MPAIKRANLPGIFVPLDPSRPNGLGWFVQDSGCHIWANGRNSNGYGVVHAGGKTMYAHRFRYEREVGPIPEGMQLDHFACDNGPHACCNPAHCRPATPRDNTLRGNTMAARYLARATCAKGHRFTEENTKMVGTVRRCRTCIRENSKERRAIRRSGGEVVSAQHRSA